MSAAAERPPRIVVVGGGISGLSAVHRVRELGRDRGIPVEADLLEATARLGGQIRTETRQGFLIDAGPDTILCQKPAGVALCERVGLAGELMRPDATCARIHVVRRGQLASLPRGFVLMAPTRVWPMLASPLFSWRGKGRILAERFVSRRPSGAPGDESLSAFVTRRFGREALERAAEPIIASLFLADADRLSLELSMPRFMEMERRHGSVTRGLRAAARGRASNGARELYVSLRDGLGSLVARLSERVPRERMRVGARVHAIGREPASGRWTVALSDDAPVPADAVVLACPAYDAAAILANLDRGLAAGLGSLEYASCATVSLAYRSGAVRLPAGFSGFFVPRAEGSPLLACSYASAKFGGRAPAGHVLLRAFLGGATRAGVLDSGDRSLVSTTHRALAALLGIEDEPVFARVHRFPRAMPQFPVGHGATLREIEGRLAAFPGLFLAGSAVGAVGLPDCIASGERAAERAVAFAAPGQPESLRI